MTRDYVTELRRLILIWEFAESLMDSDDPDRQFYTAAIDAATSRIIEAEIEKRKHALMENQNENIRN